MWTRTAEEALDAQTAEFYGAALRTLGEANVPFLVGGAYALAHYTGIQRHTKDLDVFVRPADCSTVLEVLCQAGYRTERTFPHWLAKVFCGGAFIDVIFNGGNGIASVDNTWLAHGVAAEVHGVRVHLCPPEEMIWQKAFVMERERYDGADVAHLLRARGQQLDWARLLYRFGPFWRVLLSHLILFGFIYPSEHAQIPSRIVQDLVGRLQAEGQAPAPTGKLCRGTLLSLRQYLADVQEGGYADARLIPQGNLTKEQIAHWTAASEK